MKLTKRILSILPNYAWISLGSCFILNMLVYWGSRLITVGLPHYNLALSIDALIPFWPAAITVYILSYVYWIVHWLVIAREGRDFSNHIFGGEMTAKLICLMFFLFLPTSIVRPEVTGNGLFSWLTRLIYESDLPDNLFPSIHCLDSWICWRGLNRCARVPRWVKLSSLIFALMIFASTVLVRQHVFVDILGGVAIAEAGMFLGEKLGVWRIFDRVQSKHHLGGGPIS